MPAGGVQAEEQLRYVRRVNNSGGVPPGAINPKTDNRWRYGRSVLNSVGEGAYYSSGEDHARRGSAGAELPGGT
jgi:hypothetical protein